MEQDILYHVTAHSESVLCEFLTRETALQVERFAMTIPEYEPTPLVSLDCLAERLGVSKIYVKDESKRLGLNAFKAIGVFYGAVKVLCKHLHIDMNTITYQDLVASDLNDAIRQYTFVAATDGNHGKGLARVAKCMGCKCHIYMPKNTTPARARAIEELGATVIITKYNYDDTLRLVIQEAEKHGWLHIQDQAWDGYTETTNFISQGYTIIAHEALKQMQADGTDCPTHIMIQAGAGSFAFGILEYFVNSCKSGKPCMVLAEPHNANCYYQSAQAGQYTRVTGELETVMAGLSVGEANIVAWKYLSQIVDGYISCSDCVTALGMRILGNPSGTDKPVISGESGALGVGALAAVCSWPDGQKMKSSMNLNENSKILLISTEGDTDPVMYRKIVWDGFPPIS